MNSNYDFAPAGSEFPYCKTVEREPRENFCPVRLTYRPLAVRLKFYFTKVITYADLTAKKTGVLVKSALAKSQLL